MERDTIFPDFEKYHLFLHSSSQKKKQQRQQTHLTHRFCKPENDDDDDDQILAATELQVAGELRDLAAVLAELKKTKTTNPAERYATRLGQIARGY